MVFAIHKASVIGLHPGELRVKSRTCLILLIVVAVAARLSVLIYLGFEEPRYFFTYDSDGYVIRATNLLQYGAFSGDTEPPLAPDLKRTPIYPLLLAGVLGLSRQITAIIVLQILLGSLTVLFAYLMARELRFSARAGLLAALLLAVEPVSVLLTNQLLSETLFTMALTAGIWLLVCYWRREKLGWLVASAIVLALTALTKPIAMFLPLALLPLFALARSKERLRAVFTAGLIFVVISGVLTFSWAYRNHRVGGVFTLSTIADTNLYYYRAQAVLAQAENLNADTARTRLVDEIESAAGQRSLTEGERLALQRRVALEILSKHPGLTVSTMVKGSARLLFDPGYTLVCTLLDLETTSFECFPGTATMLEANVLQKALDKVFDMTFVQQLTLLGSMVLLGVLYLGAALGMVFLALERNWTALGLLLVVSLYFLILSAGAESTYRFRAPIIPFFAVLAGAGYDSLLTRVQARLVAPAAKTRSQSLKRL